MVPKILLKKQKQTNKKTLKVRFSSVNHGGRGETNDLRK